MRPVVFAEQDHRIQHTQLRILLNTHPPFILPPHSQPTPHFRGFLVEGIFGRQNALEGVDLGEQRQTFGHVVEFG